MSSSHTATVRTPDAETEKYLKGFTFIELLLGVLVLGPAAPTGRIARSPVLSTAHSTTSATSVRLASLSSEAKVDSCAGIGGLGGNFSWKIVAWEVYVESPVTSPNLPTTFTLLPDRAASWNVLNASD